MEKYVEALVNCPHDDKQLEALGMWDNYTIYMRANHGRVVHDLDTSKKFRYAGYELLSQRGTSSGVSRQCPPQEDWTISELLYVPGSVSLQVWDTDGRDLKSILKEYEIRKRSTNSNERYSIRLMFHPDSAVKTHKAGKRVAMAEAVLYVCEYVVNFEIPSVIPTAKIGRSRGTIFP